MRPAVSDARRPRMPGAVGPTDRACCEQGGERVADLNQVVDMEKNTSTKIVFSTTEYKGAQYVDMREYVESATYTGFTKKGIRLHGDKLDEFIANLQKLKAALAQTGGPGAAPDAD